jgi:hypothetical protein
VFAVFVLCVLSAMTLVGALLISSHDPVTYIPSTVLALQAIAVRGLYE